MPQMPPETSKIPSLIYEEYEKHRDYPRAHLGASLIGHKCARFLWLSFHWALPWDMHSGRVLRLFERGQREEEVIVRNLRAIGVEIHHTCLDRDGQVRVDFGNHVAGSVDGIIEKGVPEAPKARHIAEFKTHSLKSFRDLQKNGVRESKWMHWCQMQVYMLGTGIDRALYVAVCKDNDEMYAERVRFDVEWAQRIVDRAHRIVSSEEIPPRISKDPSWFECKMCPAHEFCHVTHMCKIFNCRTCGWASCLPDGRWMCEHVSKFYLTYEEQLDLDGPCVYHALSPNLVPETWKVKRLTEKEDGVVWDIDGQEVPNGGYPEMVLSWSILDGQRVPIEEDVPF